MEITIMEMEILNGEKVDEQKPKQYNRFFLILHKKMWEEIMSKWEKNRSICYKHDKTNHQMYFEHVKFETYKRLSKNSVTLTS